MIVSLYDYTGFMLQPWAEAGFRCLAVDLLHAHNPRVESYPSGGSIEYLPIDLTDKESLTAIFDATNPKQIFAFPVCTELAGSGAKHWKLKSVEDPFFQVKAIEPITWIDELCVSRDIPYLIENPKGLLSTVWRPYDWNFSPEQYGGYLPLDDRHPLYDIIPPRDAYTKETYIWARKREKPPISPVLPITVETAGGNYSPQFALLGGKSLKTKSIRSVTPRGFAKACFLHYKDALHA